jgi:hypothetical protein
MSIRSAAGGLAIPIFFAAYFVWLKQRHLATLTS